MGSRSYVGAPRVYLTHGVHEDGEWKRMWYVNDGPRGHHFWTWREAIDYALTVKPMGRVRWGRDDLLGRVGECYDSR